VFERYTIENLRRVFRNPQNIFLELLLLNGWFYRRLPGREGIDVIERDWDNLILIDACRYDLFKELSDLPGEVEAVYSRGTESWGFMQENFVGRELHDTVYVTANPHAYKIPEGTFHDVVNLLEEAWDEELRTVPPEAVVNAAVEAHEQYPKKRLIVHFMQPHYPFIGERGRNIDYGGLESHLEADERTEYPSPWYTLLGPFASNEEAIVDAYRENHGVVFPHVCDLLERLAGRSVVSSDHGNLLGERTYPFPVRGFGHPQGVTHDKLVQVPWLVIPRREPRETVAESPRRGSDTEQELVNNRLRNLGYRT